MVGVFQTAVACEIISGRGNTFGLTIGIANRLDCRISPRLRNVQEPDRVRINLFYLYTWNRVPDGVYPAA
jgi:hypothetical protein